MSRGRHPIDDSAILKRMAAGIVEKKYESAWAAAVALAKEAGGNSAEASCKRIHRKFLKMKEPLLQEARAELEEDEEEDFGPHGFNEIAYERLAKYLLGLTNSQRAKFIANFFIWQKEKGELFQEVLRQVRLRGQSLTQDDLIFLHQLLSFMESEKMKWTEILWKVTAPPKPSNGGDEGGEPQKSK